MFFFRRVILFVFLVLLFPLSSHGKSDTVAQSSHSNSIADSKKDERGHVDADDEITTEVRFRNTHIPDHVQVLEFENGKKPEKISKSELLSQ